jgi:hypothetical protein
MFKIPWEWPRKKTGEFPKKIKPHRGTTPPSQIRLVYIPIDSSRRQDSEYILLNRYDMCRPKVMLPNAS